MSSRINAVCGNENQTYLSDTFSDQNFYPLEQQIFVHMRQYFWLNRETLQNKHFQYFDRSKRDMTELKLVWPVNMTGHRSKIILSPGTALRTLVDLIIILKLNSNTEVEELLMH